MQPIRLVVWPAEKATTSGIAARVREAVVQPCPDPSDQSISRTEWDAVLFLNPPPTACDSFKALLTSGIHVLVVADPCLDLVEMDALASVVSEKGVRFCVVNPDRYLPSRQLIHRRVPSSIGEPGLIRLHRWDRHHAEQSADPAALPNSLLLDFDTVLWLAGRSPNRVYGVEQTSNSSTGRNLQVHLGFPGGGMALIDYDGRSPSANSYHSLSVIAAHGAAYADDHQNVQLAYDAQGVRAVRTDERAAQYAAIAQDFVDDLRTARQETATLASWQAVFAVAAAVRQSLTTGRAVPLEDR